MQEAADLEAAVEAAVEQNVIAPLFCYSRSCSFLVLQPCWLFQLLYTHGKGRETYVGI